MNKNVKSFRPRGLTYVALDVDYPGERHRGEEGGYTYETRQGINSSTNWYGRRDHG